MVSALLPEARLHRFRAGEFVFRRDDAVPGVGIVGEGLIALSRTNYAGRTHVLRFVFEKQSFAEAIAIKEGKAPVDAQAVRPSSCAFVPCAVIRSLMENDLDFARCIMDTVGTRIQFLVNHAARLAEPSARMRLAQTLLASLESDDERQILEIKRRELAQYLDLTPETLSRSLKELADASIVVASDGQIEIRDLNRLRETAEGN